MVYMAHYGYDRGPLHEFCVVFGAAARFFIYKHIFLRTGALDPVSELFGDEGRRVEIYKLVNGAHNTERHKFLYYLPGLYAEPLREIRHTYRLKDP